MKAICVIYNQNIRVFYRTNCVSSTGKHIEAHDINIDAGLYLKGTVNFLGLEVSAEIKADPTKGTFFLDIAMTPIDWAGGLIALRRSATDKVNGPKAFIYLKTDSVTVQIHGYVSLLGMSREVYIDVSDTAFKFKMTTDLWGMIRSDLEVEAAYGSLATLAFKVCRYLASGADPGGGATDAQAPLKNPKICILYN